MSDERDLKVALRSRFPLVAVESFEELRVLDLLERVGNLETQPLFVWNLAEGLKRRGRTDTVPETRDPASVLRHIHATPQNGLYALVDFHPFLADPLHLRLIKNIAHNHAKDRKTVVFVSHRLELPEDLSRMTARLQMAMPDMPALRAIVKEELDDYAYREDTPVRGQREAVDLLIQQLAGLSADDARRLVRQAIHDDGAITLSDLARVSKQKQNALGAAAAISLELDVARLEDMAGAAALKRWLNLRRAAFLGQAPGLESPKGMLLVGVQGSGKSLAARAVAGAWRVPLLRLDAGALYSKWIGETERSLRDALQHAERMAPCVLWIDEIEKAFASSEGGGDSDGGLSRRMLGALLTWMAERKSAVFLVATANAIQDLPPELMRKGRIDEIFFVDLPDPQARAEIFRIHLMRRGADPANFDLSRLAAAAEGFSGAEIEQLVISGLYASHGAGQPLQTEGLLDELQRTRPLSVVAAERITALRAWARGRAVMAHDEPVAGVALGGAA
ncbi:MAG: AAA family ATPase [Burkholderiales bacterium]|nr:AAA family ATPase [Burkholderiales bacterium]